MADNTCCRCIVSAKFRWYKHILLGQPPRLFLTKWKNSFYRCNRGYVWTIRVDTTCLISRGIALKKRCRNVVPTLSDLCRTLTPNVAQMFSHAESSFSFRNPLYIEIEIKKLTRSNFTTPLLISELPRVTQSRSWIIHENARLFMQKALETSWCTTA